MAKIFLPMIIIATFFSSSAHSERLQGDFDGNGSVDFEDFLAFVKNFGRTDGDVFDPNETTRATVYDTIKVYVQELATPPPVGENEIPGLIAIADVFQTTENWDADLENDGFTYAIVLTGRDRKLNSSVSSTGLYTRLYPELKSIEGLVVTVELNVVYQNEVVYTEVRTGALIDVLYGRIEREKLEPFDNRHFTLEVKLITPAQGTFEGRLIENVENERK